tara:strand:+ start:285 stop:476 length:192 start_codon:yes stop_codon:yes gene_type:complete
MPKNNRKGKHINNCVEERIGSNCLVIGKTSNSEAMNMKIALVIKNPHPFWSAGFYKYLLKILR